VRFGVQLPVVKGLVEDEEDPTTDRAVAPLPRRIEAEDLVQYPAAPAARVEDRSHLPHAKTAQQVDKVAAYLELGLGWNNRMCGYLGADDRAHLSPRNRTTKKGHDDREGAHTVSHDLYSLLLGFLEDVIDGGRPIPKRNIVDREWL
jgi:hypothetical protein